MSEIINVGFTWRAKCSQLTPLPFKWLTYCMGESHPPKKMGVNRYFQTRWASQPMGCTLWCFCQQTVETLCFLGCASVHPSTKFVWRDISV